MKKEFNQNPVNAGENKPNNPHYSDAGFGELTDQSKNQRTTPKVMVHCAYCGKDVQVNMENYAQHKRFYCSECI